MIKFIFPLQTDLKRLQKALAQRILHFSFNISINSKIQIYSGKIVGKLGFLIFAEKGISLDIFQCLTQVHNF